MLPVPGDEDRARLAAMGAHEHREGIGLGLEPREAGVAGEERLAPGRVADAGKPGGKRAAVPRRRGPPGGFEGAADGQEHVLPGLRDALLQGRRPGGPAATSRRGWGGSARGYRCRHRPRR